MENKLKQIVLTWLVILSVGSNSIKAQNLEAGVLAETENGLLVGTRSGLYRISENGNIWTLLTKEIVYSIAIDGPIIMAGCSKGGVLSKDQGNQWTRVSDGADQYDFLYYMVVVDHIFYGKTLTQKYVFDNQLLKWKKYTKSTPDFPPNDFIPYGYKILELTSKKDEKIKWTYTDKWGKWGLYMSTNNGVDWAKADTGFYKSKMEIAAKNQSDMEAKRKADSIQWVNNAPIRAAQAAQKQKDDSIKWEKDAPLRREIAKRDSIDALRGCISGDCNNGYGVFHYDDGNKYSGNWKNGKCHGTGTLRYKNGNVFEGEWENGEKGKGKLIETAENEGKRKKEEAELYTDITCPDCSGGGHVPGLINVVKIGNSSYGTSAGVTCPHCYGTGNILQNPNIKKKDFKKYPKSLIR